MHEVKKTELTDDRGPKDEFEKIKELWECWEDQGPTCQKMMTKMNQDTTEPKQYVLSNAINHAYSIILQTILLLLCEWNALWSLVAQLGLCTISTVAVWYWVEAVNMFPSWMGQYLRFYICCHSIFYYCTPSVTKSWQWYASRCQFLWQAHLQIWLD
jgi:hypothetical protein